MSDDYLYDKSGPPDPEVQRLEAMLSRYQNKEPLRVIPLRPRSFVWARRIAVAAVILIGAFGTYLVLLPRFGQPGSEWRVTAREGAPSIEGAPLQGTGALRLGQALSTDASSRAELRAGSVGSIEVAPNSILRLIQTGAKRHRLALERGRISARLWSPPFTFSFDTPAAIATDLGCAFTLEAGKNGEDVVHVTSGWVEFYWEDRQELIPAGASAIAIPGRGPGTVFFDDASDEFKSALREINFGPSDHSGALQRLLRSARARDVYSLLRLSIRVSGADRGLIYDRAAELVPPPPGIARKAFVDRDPGALDAWVDSLGLGGVKRWWVHWKDAF